MARKLPAGRELERSDGLGMASGGSAEEGRLSRGEGRLPPCPCRSPRGPRDGIGVAGGWNRGRTI